MDTSGDGKLSEEEFIKVAVYKLKLEVTFNYTESFLVTGYQ